MYFLNETTEIKLKKFNDRNLDGINIYGKNMKKYASKFM